MTLATWRKDAMAHCVWLLKVGGQEYALHAADKAERESGGVLDGLGKALREAIEARRMKGAADAAR